MKKFNKKETIAAHRTSSQDIEAAERISQPLGQVQTSDNNTACRYM
jgi:hypothetical protein